MLKIGINGFGRIGRMVLRAYLENKGHYPDIQIVAINDISDLDTNIHLLKYDSVHGRLGIPVSRTDNGFSAGDSEFYTISSSSPENINWSNYGVDIVLECSGRFTKREDALKHVSGSVKKVIISAPSPDADNTVVFGVNHETVKDSDIVISNGSCTTNCIAPVAYVIDKHFGIQCGYMTTIHSYTGDQRLIDTAHKDLRRARAAALSMIPSSTGAAKAVGLILPHLKGRLDGTAIRVPTPNVSLVDFKCLLKKESSKEQINDLMQEASKTSLINILGYCDEPLVSIDFNHSTESSIFDATGTTLLDGKFCRVMSWYDNEFGFSNRMLDLASYLALRG